MCMSCMMLWLDIAGLKAETPVDSHSQKPKRLMFSKGVKTWQGWEAGTWHMDRAGDIGPVESHGGAPQVSTGFSLSSH